jgi:hypothetical protein
LIIVWQRHPDFLPIPFEEMARRHNLKWKRIQSILDEEDNDSDGRSVEGVNIVSGDSDEVVTDVDLTPSDGELENKLQYQCLLEDDSSERQYMGETRGTTDFHGPPNEASAVDDIIVRLSTPINSWNSRRTLTKGPMMSTGYIWYFGKNGQCELL